MEHTIASGWGPGHPVIIAATFEFVSLSCLVTTCFFLRATAKMCCVSVCLGIRHCLSKIPSGPELEQLLGEGQAAPVRGGNSPHQPSIPHHLGPTTTPQHHLGPPTPLRTNTNTTSTQFRTSDNNNNNNNTAIAVLRTHASNKFSHCEMRAAQSDNSRLLVCSVYCTYAMASTCYQLQDAEHNTAHHTESSSCPMPQFGCFNWLVCILATQY